LVGEEEGEPARAGADRRCAGNERALGEILRYARKLTGFGLSLDDPANATKHRERSAPNATAITACG
jgi:hypothetical protein